MPLLSQELGVVCRLRLSRAFVWWLEIATPASVKRDSERRPIGRPLSQFLSAVRRRFLSWVWIEPALEKLGYLWTRVKFIWEDSGEARLTLMVTVSWYSLRLAGSRQQLLRITPGRFHQVWKSLRSSSVRLLVSV